MFRLVVESLLLFILSSSFKYYSNKTFNNNNNNNNESYNNNLLSSLLSSSDIITNNNNNNNNQRVVQQQSITFEHNNNEINNNNNNQQSSTEVINNNRILPRRRLGESLLLFSNIRNGVYDNNNNNNNNDNNNSKIIPFTERLHTYVVRNRCRIQQNEVYIPCAGHFGVIMRQVVVTTTTTADVSSPTCIEKCIVLLTSIEESTGYECGTCASLLVGSVVDTSSSSLSSSSVVVANVVPVPVPVPVPTLLVSSSSSSSLLVTPQQQQQQQQQPTTTIGIQDRVPWQPVDIIPRKVPTIAPRQRPRPRRFPTRRLPTRKPTKRPTMTRQPTKVPIIPKKPTYSIQLDLVNMPNTDKKIFRSAATRWSNIIMKDLLSYNSSTIPKPPKVGCTYPTIIDDLYICGQYQYIDGISRILGYGGVKYLRILPNGKRLTLTGEMVFDIDDVPRLIQSKTLSSVVLHEMGHVLGIGSLWVKNNVTGGNKDMNCPYYGTNANREYKKLSGCRTVPVELDGSNSTRCYHFDDECLQNELMTGYLNQNIQINPLSRITIASLRDIGYTDADYNKADQYERSNINPNCLCNRRHRRRRVQDEKKNNIPLKDDSSYRTERSSSSDNNHHKKEQKSSSQQQRQHRRLSDEGQLYAKKFGISILRQRMEENFKYGNLPLVSNPNIQYEGDQTLTVLYFENDHIYDVHVSSNDFFV